MSHIIKSKEDKVVHAILSAQLALNMNEELKHSVPQFFKNTLKSRTKNYLDELVKNEKLFDEFFDLKEQSLVDVYNVYEKFIKVIALVPLWEMENLCEVVKSYMHDKPAFERTVKRVNNQLKKQANND